MDTRNGEHSAGFRRLKRMLLLRYRRETTDYHHLPHGRGVWGFLFPNFVVSIVASHTGPHVTTAGAIQSKTMDKFPLYH